MVSEQNDRSKVANLLRQVRIGRISSRQAVMAYPRDVEDESLIAAYHALIHYEADEDIRLRDPLYKEEQDDYLEFIASVLEKDEDLPQNIIDNYKNFYQSAPMLHKKGFSGFLKSFWKVLNIRNNK